MYNIDKLYTDNNEFMRKKTTKKAPYTGCLMMSHRGFEPLTL